MQKSQVRSHFNQRNRLSRADDKSCHTIPTLGPARTDTGAVSLRPLLSFGHSDSRDVTVGEAIESIFTRSQPVPSRTEPASPHFNDHLELQKIRQ